MAIFCWEILKAVAYDHVPFGALQFRIDHAVLKKYEEVVQQSGEWGSGFWGCPIQEKYTNILECCFRF